eukprot:TRINITY_DN6205_c0_g2_i4.p1 TRINITY_DN6205_c0_g2~~TRINITY_DN6205_c0_g2_i4.p1  ORF type:complete len:1015 (-),score=105.94 TRINITY_DN6205_c0_g2_i4:52-3096(-)
MFAKGDLKRSASWVPNSLKILSFNLNLLPGLSFTHVSSPGHGYGSQRLTEFLELIKNDNYDIILLQEVFSTPHLPCLCLQKRLMSSAKKLGYFVLRGPQPTLMDLILKKKWTDSGLIIMSKFNWKEWESITFEQTAHLDAGASKGVLWAKISVGDTLIHVFNCHLQASHTRKSYDDIRRHQLDALRRFIVQKTHGNREYAWILGGDFNVDAIQSPDQVLLEGTPQEESEEYRQLMNIIDPSKRVKDLLKVANNGFHPSTRPPREVINSILGIFRHKPVQRLDYLFLMEPEDQSFKSPPQCTKVITFQVSKKPFAYVSDHYGIATRLVYDAHDIDRPKQIPEEVPVVSFAQRFRKMKSLLISFVLVVFALIGIWFFSSKLLALFLITYLGWIFYEKFRQVKVNIVSPKKVKPKYNLTPENEVHPSVLSFSPGLHTELRANTIHENFLWSVRHFSYKNCLGYREKRDGELTEYTWLTYDMVFRRVLNFGSGLCNFGVKPGSKVMIVSENRPEWVISDQACHAYGFTTVPIIRGGKKDFIENVLLSIRPDVIITSCYMTKQILQVIIQNNQCKPALLMVQMERPEYEEYILAEKAAVKLVPFDFIEQSGVHDRHPTYESDETSVASLVYSSRTNGLTKCVPITNQNYVAMARNLLSAHHLNDINLCEDDIHLSSFPLARPFETVIYILYISLGASIAFTHKDSRFFTDAGDVKPSVIYCVPSSFLKMYGTYKIAVASWSSIHQYIFHKVYQFRKNTESLEKKKHLSFQNYFKLSMKHLVDHLIFSRFSANVGGRVKLILVSSKGHLSDAHKTFLRIIFGCPVSQCHIRTETGIFACSSSQALYGMLPLSDIKLEPHPSFSHGGEICVRGPNVVKEYFDEDDDSEERFGDGWYKTREIAKWNSNGTLTVYGHVLEVLQPKPGKFVFPRHLEYQFSDSDFVHQIIILGKEHKPLVGIVVPDYEVVYRWAKQHRVKESYNPDSIYQNPDVIKAILDDLKTIAETKKMKSTQHLRYNINKK